MWIGTLPLIVEAWTVRAFRALLEKRCHLKFKVFGIPRINRLDL